MKQLLGLMLLTTLVWAERSGPFFTLGYGVSRFYDDGYLVDQGYRDRVDDTGQGVRIGVGFYIDHHLSVALEYHDLGHYYGHNEAGERLEATFASTGIVVMINTPPMVDQFEGFIRLGASELQWNQKGVAARSDQAGALMIGGGVRYRFDDEVAISLDYSNDAFKLVDDGDGYAWDIDSVTLSFEVMF